MRKHLILWLRRSAYVAPLSVLLLTAAVMVNIALGGEAFALDVTEADCRACHCDSVDTHHLLVQAGAYGCTDCHAVTYGEPPAVTRDCLICHGSGKPTPADRHHLLAADSTYGCMDCHTLVCDPDCAPVLNTTCISEADAETNEPPVADAGPDQTAKIRRAVTLSGEASYDPYEEIVEYRWYFGDGTEGTGVTTSHTYDSPGVFTATLSVTDNKGAMSSDTAVITVTKAKPK